MSVISATKNPIGHYSQPSPKEIIERAVGERLPEKWSPSFKNNIKKVFTTMPFAAAEVFLACSFIQGLLQCLQEALLQLFPKVAAGLAIRKSLKMGAYEATVEVPEWGNFYLLPTLFAALMAKFLTHSFKLPHFEALSPRMYDLEQKAGKIIEIGTLQKKFLHLNHENMNKLYISKLLLFAMTTLLAMAGGAIVPAMRLPIFQKLFGTLDFYKICGLDSKEDNPEAAKAAMKQAIKNIQYALGAILLGIPSLMLASKGLSKLNYAKMQIPQLLKSLSKILDLSGNFGLSKVFVSFGVLFAGLYTYPSVALNPAERSEMMYRVLFFSIPCVLWFKQIVGNIAVFLTSSAFKLKNPELKKYRVFDTFKTYLEESKSGKRDIFNVGLVGIEKHKGIYSGRLPYEMQDLHIKNPLLYKKYLGSLHFAEHWFPYIWAIVTGFAINGLTYQNTVKAHEKEKEKQKKAIIL